MMIDVLCHSIIANAAALCLLACGSDQPQVCTFVVKEAEKGIDARSAFEACCNLT